MEKEKAIAADQWSWGSLKFKWYIWLVGVGNFINLKHSKHLHSRIVPCWHVPCVQDRHLHFALCIDAIDSYVYAEVILKVYHVGMKLDGCQIPPFQTDHWRNARVNEGVVRPETEAIFPASHIEFFVSPVKLRSWVRALHQTFSCSFFSALAIEIR